MGCREWGTELTDWALDELSPAKVRELEQHLGQCEDCARSAQRLRGVRQALTSSLTDRAMPAHLVFLGEKSQPRSVDFWPALLRTAALSASAAVIFVAVAAVGVRYGGTRLLPATAWARQALTGAELRALVSQAVAAQVSSQSREIEVATREQVASLRQEQSENLARIARHLQFLEMEENTQYKETQQQEKLLSLVAHDQPLPTNPPAEH